MIVLMATGNTPIMDWNIFNGFRALAANIAVEIPEAPMGGNPVPDAVPGCPAPLYNDLSGKYRCGNRKAENETAI